MNHNDDINLKVISGIDDDIIERASIKRFKLFPRASKPRRFGKKALIIAIAAALVLSLMCAILIPLLTKDVPIYKGMSVSGKNAYSTLDADAELSLEFLADGGNGKDNGNNSGGDKKGGGQSEKDSLGIVGGGEPAYFAKKNQDIYITVHIDNPDEFEIVSFTLNGVKYTNYMFEDGSDLEHLVLKVNVGEAQGYVDYTIDAIKYIDGTTIKDVKMEGDKTVKVGVYPENQPKATAAETSVDYNSVSLKINIDNELGLITENDSVYAVLKDMSGAKIASAPVNNSGETEITFEGLDRATEYLLTIFATYDAVDGKGVLVHKALETTIWTKADEVSYTVNHYLQNEDGEYSLEDTEILTGTENREVTPKVKSFEHYKSPEAQSGIVLVDGSLVINYYYDIIGYKTTFVTNGGDEIGVYTKPFGSAINIPDATREGYSFGGWFTDTNLTKEYKETTQGDKDVTLYAYWKEETRASEFQFKDGNIEKFIGTSTDIVIPSYIGGVKVLRIGVRAFEDCSSLTSVNIPEGVTSIEMYAFDGCTSLTSIKISKGVTNIGDGAFYGCTSLASINIPEGVTKIGSGAFYGCTSLTSVNIPDGVTSMGVRVFEDCSNLKSITIPEGVTSIGASAFKDCSNLKSITIPEGVTSIESNAFYGCTSLTSINIPDGVTSIGDYAFNGCSNLTSIKIPEGVTSIGDRAFCDCKSLKSITIPEGVTSIGERTFYECTSLTSVNIPEGVTSIGNSAFYNCSNLKSINIPDGVTSIGNSAFYGCSSLTSIKIPDEVTSIGEYAFSGCSSFTSIKIPDEVTSIGNSAFAGCSSLTSINISEGVTSIGNSAFDGCRSLKSITIPKGVTSIGQRTFYFCTSLTSVNISEGVTSIGNSAFSGCTSLTSINIPEGVTSIGEHAFYACSSLKSITISEGVTSIGKSAFENCRSLKSITIPEGVKSIGDRAFSGCSSLTSIKIPEGVTIIGDDAFSGCSSLTSINIPDGIDVIKDSTFNGCYKLESVVIPDSVLVIVADAFDGCGKLTDVYFTGSEAKWNEVVIHGGNDYLKNATIHYNYNG